MGKQSTVYAVEIPLKNEDAAKIAESVPGEWSPAAKIAGVAKGLVQEFVDGGMMFPAAVIDRMRGSVDFQEPEEIVEMVERGADKAGAQDIYEVKIDPTYRAQLAEQAEYQSVAVKYLVSDMINFALDNGWLYEMPADVHKVRFSPLEAEKIGALLGKVAGERFDGAELARFLKDKFYPDPQAEPEEDPPMLDGAETDLLIGEQA